MKKLYHWVRNLLNVGQSNPFRYDYNPAEFGEVYAGNSFSCRHA